MKTKLLKGLCNQNYKKDHPGESTFSTQNRGKQLDKKRIKC